MKKKMNNIKVFKCILFVLVFLIIIYNTIYLFSIIKDIATPEGKEIFKEKITNTGFSGMLMLFSLQIAQIFLAIIPGEPLEILAGMCYGWLGGTIFILVTVLITTTTIFHLVRKFGKKFVYEFLDKKKVDKIQKSKTFNNPKKIEFIIFILFFIPGTPKDLLIYISGLLPIKPLRFILISTFARFPSIISSTLAGSNIMKGDFKTTILIYVVTFLIAIEVFIIVNLFDKNKETREVFNEMKKW